MKYLIYKKTIYIIIFNGSEVQNNINIKIAEESFVFLFSIKNPNSSDFATAL